MMTTLIILLVASILFIIYLIMKNQYLEGQLEAMYYVLDQVLEIEDEEGESYERV